MSDKKDVIDLTPSANRDYLDRIAKAKSGGVPLGGAPMPKMPRFDQPPAGDRYTGVQAANTLDRLLTPEQKAELERQNKLMPGVGSAYAANQPQVQEQKVVNPPRTERGLSPETISGLEQMAADKKAQIEDEPAKADPADEVDNYDDALNQKTRSLINNRKRREAIEKRIVDKIDIEDLIIHQEFRQRVPIIPNKFVPTFRSVGGQEDLWIKRQMGSETGSDTYIIDKYAMMNLCCGLYALNDSVLPTHLDVNGLVDEKLFNNKLNIILKYPWNLLADLSTNFVWFLRRVEQALVVDDIKGF